MVKKYTQISCGFCDQWETKLISKQRMTEAQWDSYSKYHQNELGFNLRITKMNTHLRRSKPRIQIIFGTTEIEYIFSLVQNIKT